MHKAMRGARSTLRSTDREAADLLTKVIESRTPDDTKMDEEYLHHVHRAMIAARSKAYSTDEQAADLLDVVHNIPHGLLGKHYDWEGWYAHLPEELRRHEDKYLTGFRKYSGMLKLNTPE